MICQLVRLYSPVRCTKRRRLRVTTLHWSMIATVLVLAVGLCTLNQVDP
jgi:hypothetical protein